MSWKYHCRMYERELPRLWQSAFGKWVIFCSSTNQRFSLLNPMCDKSRWRSSSSSREIKLLLLLHQYDGHISFLRFLKFSFLSWILPLTPSFALNPTSSFIFLPLPQCLGLPTSSIIFSTTIFASSNSFIYLAIRCWLLQNKKEADAKND